MSLPVSLGTLRTAVLERANMENSTLLAAGFAETDRHINAALRELYEEILSCYGDEYFAAQSAPISTTSGVDTYSLDFSFYKLLGVDCQFAGTTLSLEKFSFRERNKYKSDLLYATSVRPLLYRLKGQNLVLIPAPTGGVVLTVHYIPAPTTLVAPADTFDGQAGWEEFAIWSATASLLAKEESDSSYAVSMKEAARVRIRNMAPNRDAASPEHVTDTQRDQVPWWVLLS